MRKRILETIRAWVVTKVCPSPTIDVVIALIALAAIQRTGSRTLGVAESGSIQVPAMINQVRHTILNEDSVSGRVVHVLLKSPFGREFTIAQ